MNWKLFFSTFALIFVAELGDKTQLAAMARAATGQGGKWTVFYSASLALVCSTLVAVLVGGALTRLIPEPYIKMGAGVLFVGFGVAIFWSALAPREAVAQEEGKSGAIANLVLRLAAQFEEAAADDYERLAAEAPDPRTRRVMEWLSESEREHLKEIRSLARGEEAVAVQTEFLEALPDEADVTHDVAVDPEPILAHAIEHEAATAQFYSELSRLTPLSSLKQVFRMLAEQEHDHVKRLRELVEES